MANREAEKLKPGTLLTKENGTTALVLGKKRRHGIQFYEILVNYPSAEDNDLRGGVQLWRAKDILETFEVQHGAG
jgi:hypothetical protein